MNKVVFNKKYKIKTCTKKVKVQVPQIPFSLVIWHLYVGSFTCLSLCVKEIEVPVFTSRSFLQTLNPFLAPVLFQISLVIFLLPHFSLGPLPAQPHRVSACGRDFGFNNQPL